MTALAALSPLPALLAQAGGTAPPEQGAGFASGHTSDVVAAPDIIWQAMLPVLILGVGAIVLLTISSLVRSRLSSRVYAGYTVVVALAAAASSLVLWARVQGWDHLLWWHPDLATKGPFSTFGGACTVSGQAIVEPGCGAVGVDGFSLVVTMVICASVVLGALLASDYLRREGLVGPELYVLMLLSATGGVVMAMANDLMVLFLGLETLSIAVYVLAALHLRRLQSQEAGLKYFVLGAFSSAFFLYGIALVYGATATTNLVSISNLLSQKVFNAIPAEGPVNWQLNSPLLLIGIALLLVGLGFKVAAVPFHFWSPDVYDGSPTPVVAFMASGVKVAAFAAFVRVLVLGFQAYTTTWRPAVSALAVLSMVIGAGLAIVQSNVKRTLAYSSINHAGFILMALYASSDQGNRAVLFYLVAYTFMVVGSFAVVTVVARRGDNRVGLDDYRGLSRTSPGLALVFTIFLLAQAGVPFTSGFVAKLYTIVAAIDAQGTWLAIIAMVTSVVAAFLYLRIIVSMYMASPVDAAARKIRVPTGAAVTLGLCLFVTVAVGLFPGKLTDWTGEGRAVLVNTPEAGGGAPPTAGPGIDLGAPPGAPTGTP
jgi:NADH-quinone oxidoreductase subunit N